MQWGCPWLVSGMHQACVGASNLPSECDTAQPRPSLLSAACAPSVMLLLLILQKCPFDAIMIINLPKNLEGHTTHRYGPNSFKLHR